MSGANSARVLVLQGPNLNLLGKREPEIYGSLTLIALSAQCEAAASSLGLLVHFAQHNSEGSLIDALHASANTDQGVIFNPGGYTHTSVALHDAIRAIEIPVVEVHLSNIYKREGFRQRSITGSACAGVIQGFGAESYRLALHYLAGVLTTQTPDSA
jgi:3-dehydroquinate dehydratase-2